MDTELYDSHLYPNPLTKKQNPNVTSVHIKESGVSYFTDNKRKAELILRKIGGEVARNQETDIGLLLFCSTTFL